MIAPKMREDLHYSDDDDFQKTPKLPPKRKVLLLLSLLLPFLLLLSLLPPPSLPSYPFSTLFPPSPLLPSFHSFLLILFSSFLRHLSFLFPSSFLLFL